MSICETEKKKVLGKGAYGKVYQHSKTRALKVVNKKHFDKNEFLINYVLGEAKIAPKVYNIERCDNNVHIVMQKIDTTLDKWLMKQRSAKSKTKAYTKIIELIKKMHDMNIVHGDIKSDNIGKIGSRWVLIDFGHSFYKSNKSLLTNRGKYIFRHIDATLKSKTKPNNSGYTKHIAKMFKE